MNKPLVSIVTPCYNGAEYLKRFFDSIILQKYEHLQLVFVNDGSTDSTLDVARDYQSEFEEQKIDFVILSQDNEGQASALNNGLKKAEGEFILCMDSDDSLSENYISEAVKYMENNPSSAYCYGNACSLSDNGNVLESIGKRIAENKKDMFYDIIFHPQKVFFSGYVVRTECFDKVIKDREIYTGKGGQNVQILLPLAWSYGEPAFIDSITYNYYIRSDSHSHSQTTTEKVIAQLVNYKKILIETLKNISDSEFIKLINDINIHYTKLCFDNSIDTQNPIFIEKYYNEMKSLKILTLKERLLKLKYCNFNRWVKQ